MISWVAMDRLRKESAPPMPLTASKAQTRCCVRMPSGSPMASCWAKLPLSVSNGPPSLERLCGQALSAEEIATPLLDQRTFRGRQAEMESDWIWICLTASMAALVSGSALFRGTGRQDARPATNLQGPPACRIWLEAWSDVLALLDKASMHIDPEFDERFRRINRCSIGFRIWKTHYGMRGWRIGSF